jgi:hypothetical protein
VRCLPDRAQTGREAKSASPYGNSSDARQVGTRHLRDSLAAGRWSDLLQFRKEAGAIPGGIHLGKLQADYKLAGSSTLFTRAFDPEVSPSNEITDSAAWLQWVNSIRLRLS